MTTAARPTADRGGIDIVDRRSGRRVTEVVLGDRWMRLAYAAPLRPLTRMTLFRWAFCSRLMGWYADRPRSRRGIRRTIAALGIDTAEFRDPVESFSTFNEFFYRHLRPEARPFDPSPDALLSPADCRLLVMPELTGETCVPVKGRAFTVPALLGPGHTDLAERFRGGALAVCRLCPADYHRYHYPAGGTETQHWAVPGRFDSVNPMALALGLEVFTHNRRQISLLDLDVFGTCAFVEVGAFGVAGIVQTHARGPFARMAEKGYFTFGGSTLVLVFTPGSVAFADDLVDNSRAGLETLVRCGETIGRRPA